MTALKKVMTLKFEEIYPARGLTNQQSSPLPAAESGDFKKEYVMRVLRAEPFGSVYINNIISESHIKTDLVLQTLEKLGILLTRHCNNGSLSRRYLFTKLGIFS